MRAHPLHLCAYLLAAALAAGAAMPGARAADEPATGAATGSATRAATEAAAAAGPLVAVTAIARDAAIDAIYTGLTDALRDAGYRDGDTVRLRFDSAEADVARAGELVRAFGRARADIIVALTEPSVRIAAAERLRAPLVIAAIDAAAADDLRHDRRARLLTGVVDGARFDTQLALIREVAPTIRRVAIPVNADEPPDPQAMRQLAAFARTIDLAVEALPVSPARGVVAAAIDGYAREETALFLDTRIFPDAPVDRLIAAGEAANLLVFASDEDTVVRGALAAIVTDPYGTGRQIGRLVARILAQPSAARAPLQPAEPSYMVINQDTAARVGITIPDTVLTRRGRIVDWADVGGPRPRNKPTPPPATGAAGDPPTP